MGTPCPGCGRDRSVDTPFCPLCGAPRGVAALALAGAGVTDAVTMEGAASASPLLATPMGASSPAADLTPGLLVAGRYRIVALLGRGGMGEVYRADDLKLGQAVALKFLPRALEGDPTRLERFLNEVRTAREVSHPNVCRVHDVGELAGPALSEHGESRGRHFLSMEYIDGEDLASLLRRIGRLPSDKALEIARQLCAGLAAAHDRGVLHRDLKPANVMLDGRGRVRLTDFGLAETAGAGSTELAGTPAYMAPEQFAGQPASVRTDIYALGLVLYEVFTGRRVFDAETIADLRRLHDESRPPSLGSVIRDGDPAVERVIHRCLDKDPAQRPASVVAVAAALPGGDPLAAALAAGETPSPAMVAAAGTQGALRPGVAFAWFAGIIVGLLAVAYIAARSSALERVPKPFGHDVLAVKAQEMLGRLGYASPPADEAWALEWDGDYVQYASRQAASFASASHTGHVPVVFWYRSSPARLFAQIYDGDSNGASSKVRWNDPPRELVGMHSVKLDPLGRLLALDVVPPGVETQPDAAAPPPAVDWRGVLGETGIATASLAPATPSWTPPAWADTRAAWTGRYPDLPDIPLRVEAAAYGGKVTFLQVVAPWTRSDRAAPTSPTPGERASQALQLGIVLALLVGSVFIARRNMRLGRGDRHGAGRIAMATGAIVAVRWLFGSHHVADMSEVVVLLKGLGSGCFVSAWMWLLYVGLEPFVRRRWPHTLIGWNRLLIGRLTDPLVGRDLLVGASGGLLLSALTLSLSLTLNGTDLAHLPSIWPLAGIRAVADFMAFTAFQALLNALGLVFLLFLLRLALRRDLLMAAAFIVLMSAAVLGSGATDLTIAFAVRALWALIVVTILARFGLLAFAVACLFDAMLVRAPLTTDVSAWHAGPTIAGLVLLAGLAAYGMKVSLAGQSLLGAGLDGE